MDKKTYDRLISIQRRWAAVRQRYPQAVKDNQLQNLSVKEVAEDILFLIEQAWESGRAERNPAALERLRNLDTEFREFEQNNAKSIHEKKNAPMGVGRIVREIEFLCGLAQPASEPAATV